MTSKSRTRGGHHPFLAAALQQKGVPHDELLSAWNSMHDVKSKLRNAEDRLEDLGRPLYHKDLYENLPPYLWSLVEEERFESTDSGLEGSTDLEPYLHYSNGSADLSKRRRVSRLRGRYDDFSDTQQMPGLNNSSITHQMNSQSFPGHAHNNTTMATDITSSTAVRETDVQYLNDVNVNEGRKMAPSTEYTSGGKRHKVDFRVVGTNEGSGVKDGNVAYINGTHGAGERMNGATQSGRRTVTFHQPLETSAGSLSINQDMNGVTSGFNASDEQQNFRQRDYDNIMPNGIREQPLTRKVVSGSMAQTYPGFNIPLNPDERPIQSSVTNASKNSNKVEKPDFLYWVTEDAAAVDSSGKPNRRLANHNRNNKHELITTSCWRDATRLAKQQLGPSPFIVNQANLSQSQQSRNRRKSPNKKRTGTSSKVKPTNDESGVLSDNVLTNRRAGNKSTGAVLTNENRSDIEEESEDELSRSLDEIKEDDDESKIDLKKPKNVDSWLVKKSSVKREGNVKNRENVNQKQNKMRKSGQIEETKKAARTVAHVTSDEVREFMDRQRSDRIRSRLDKVKAEQSTRSKIQEHLTRLRETQRQAVKRAKKRPLNTQQMTGGSDSLENSGRLVVTNNDDDESDDDYDDDDEDDEVKHQENLSKQAMAPPVPLELEWSTDGREPTAEEIVSKFASESGLSLEDVVRNYSKYAEQIHQSFLRHKEASRRGLGAPVSKISAAEFQDGGPAPLLSFQERLSEIVKSAKQLRGKLNRDTNELTDPTLRYARDREGRRELLDDRELEIGMRVREWRGERERENDFNSEPNLPGYSGLGAGPDSVAGRGARAPSTGERGDRDLLTSGEYLRSAADAKRGKENKPIRLQPSKSFVSRSETEETSGALCPVKAVSSVPRWQSSQITADPYNVLQIFSRRHKDSRIERVKKRCYKRSSITVLQVSTRSTPTTNKITVRKQAELAAAAGLADHTPFQIYTNQRKSNKSSSPQPANSEEEIDEVTHTNLSERSHWLEDEEVGQVDLDKGHHMGDTRVNDDYDDVSRKSNHDDDDDDDDDSGDFESTSIAPFSRSAHTAGVTSVSKVRSHGDVVAMDTDNQSDFSAVSSLTSEPYQTKVSPDSALLSSANQSEQSLVLSVQSLHNVNLPSPRRLGSMPAGGLDRGRVGRAPAGSVGMMPAALEARMALELNLLDSVEESLRQVSDIERTRAVALAQQETVTLAQILKGRQQNQAAELQAARLKAGEEGLASVRQAQLNHAESLHKQQQAAAQLMHDTAQSASNINKCVEQLLQAQGQITRAAAEANHLIDEMTVVKQSEQLRTDNTKQLLAESAAEAANRAANSVLRHLESRSRSRELKLSGSLPDRETRGDKQSSRRSATSPVTESVSQVSGNSDDSVTSDLSETSRGRSSRSSTHGGTSRPASSLSGHSSKHRPSKVPSRPNSARSIHTEFSRPSSVQSVRTELSRSISAESDQSEESGSSSLHSIMTEVSRPSSARSVHTEVSRPASAAASSRRGRRKSGERKSDGRDTKEKSGKSDKISPRRHEEEQEKRGGSKKTNEKKRTEVPAKNEVSKFEKISRSSKGHGRKSPDDKSRSPRSPDGKSRSPRSAEDKNRSPRSPDGKTRSTRSPDQSRIRSPETRESRSGDATDTVSVGSALTGVDESRATSRSRSTSAVSESGSRSASVISDEEMSHNTSRSVISRSNVSRSNKRRSADDDAVSVRTEISGRDYSMDYEEGSHITSEDMEKSLREIIPSEVERKKMIKKSALNQHEDDGGSFSKFSVALVQQYLKEESIRQKHQHSLLVLRQRALKEKTRVDLRWLEQQRQSMRSKAADDKHPELIKSRKRILRYHRLQQDDLRRLEEASKLSMQAQKLMLLQSHGISRIQKSTQQVKDKLKDAGVEIISFTSADLTTEDDISLHIEDDDDKQMSVEKSGKKTRAHQMIDQKYLPERQQSLYKDKSSLDRTLSQVETDQTKDRTSAHSVTESVSENLESNRERDWSSSAANRSKRKNKEQDESSGDDISEASLATTVESVRKTKDLKNSEAVSGRERKSDNKIRKKTPEYSDSDESLRYNSEVRKVEKIVQELRKELETRRAEAAKVKKKRNDRKIQKLKEEESQLKAKIKKYEDIIREARRSSTEDQLSEELSVATSPESLTNKTKQGTDATSRKHDKQKSSGHDSSADITESLSNNRTQSPTKSLKKTDDSGVLKLDLNAPTNQKQEIDAGEEPNQVIDNQVIDSARTLADVIEDLSYEESKSLNSEEKEKRSKVDHRSDIEIEEPKQEVSDKNQKDEKPDDDDDDFYDDKKHDDDGDDKDDGDVISIQSIKSHKTNGTADQSQSAAAKQQSELSHHSYAADFTAESHKSGSSSSATPSSESSSQQLSVSSNASSKSAASNKKKTSASEEETEASEIDSELEVASEDEEEEDLGGDGIKIIDHTQNDETSVDKKKEFVNQDLTTNEKPPSEEQREIDSQTGTNEQNADDIYAELSNLKDDDDWLMKVTNADASGGHSGTTTPRPATPQQNRALTSPRLPPPPIYKTEDASVMIGYAIQIVWNSRDPITGKFSARYSPSPLDGNPEVENPSDVNSDNENQAINNQLERQCRASYDHLIFDLTSQMLNEQYTTPDSDPAVSQPWLKPKVWSTHRLVPASLDSVKPVVEWQVLGSLRLQDAAGRATSPLPRRKNRMIKWTERKRKERVDEILIDELQEEEVEWVNYDRDELKIKNQITESLLQLLISDTVSVIKRVTNLN